MKPHDMLALVKTSYKAYETKDRAMIEGVIGLDFHFTSPLDNRVDRETYFERCWPNSEHLADFAFIHLVVNEDKAFVTYEARTDSGKRFQNTEIMTLRGGKIVDVEVYFGWSIPHPAPAGAFVHGFGPG